MTSQEIEKELISLIQKKNLPCVFSATRGYREANMKKESRRFKSWKKLTIYHWRRDGIDFYPSTGTIRYKGLTFNNLSLYVKSKIKEPA